MRVVKNAELQGKGNGINTIDPLSYKHNLINKFSLFSSKTEQKLTDPQLLICWLYLNPQKRTLYNKTCMLFYIGSTEDNIFNLGDITFICHLFSNILEFSLQQDSQIYGSVMEEQTMEHRNKTWSKWDDATVDSCKFYDLGQLNLVSKTEVKFRSDYYIFQQEASNVLKKMMQ